MTLCSPVLGWVKISTWIDTSPTASSTPEPDRAKRQHEAPWESFTSGNRSFSHRADTHNTSQRCYILLLLPKHHVTHKPNPVRPAATLDKWTKLDCFLITYFLITCNSRTGNEPVQLCVCILWQPDKAAMSGLCLFILVLLSSTAVPCTWDIETSSSSER